MKTTALGWLVLLLIPGCLLVQPLDSAKPDDDDDDTVPAAQAGNAGKASGGSGPGAAGTAGTGGTGNKAGSGPVPAGGSANGGAPSGVDFSLFTGTWTITSGQTTTTCDDGTPSTEAIAPGGTDQVGLGTTSDLIFGPGSSCEILGDVSDRTAYLNSDTLPCADTDGTYYYYLSFESFEFAVSSNGMTADASMTTTVLTADANDNLVASCTVDQTWKYRR